MDEPKPRFPPVVPPAWLQNWADLNNRVIGDAGRDWRLSRPNGASFFVRKTMEREEFIERMAKYPGIDSASVGWDLT